MTLAMVCALLIVGGLYWSGVNHASDRRTPCTLCADDTDSGTTPTTTGGRPVRFAYDGATLVIESPGTYLGLGTEEESFFRATLE